MGLIVDAVIAVKKGWMSPSRLNHVQYDVVVKSESGRKSEAFEFWDKTLAGRIGTHGRSFA